MKSFRISLVFLTVTVLAVSFNAHFVSKHFSCTYESIMSLPILPTEDELIQIRHSVSEIRDDWEESLPFLSLSVKGERLRDLTVSLGNLERYCETLSVPDYEAMRSECLVRLDYLRKTERFSFLNVI
jgi:hypothetical protein